MHMDIPYKSIPGTTHYFLSIHIQQITFHVQKAMWKMKSTKVSKFDKNNAETNQVDNIAWKVLCNEI